MTNNELKMYTALEAENAELKRQVEELQEELSMAVKILKEGKARYAPHTTNSILDVFLNKHNPTT